MHYLPSHFPVADQVGRGRQRFDRAMNLEPLMNPRSIAVVGASQRASVDIGADAYLARLNEALRYVASHTPDDAETRAWVADVSVRRNGHEPSVVRIERARP